jgi:isoaspartyl peptidase/L-asparaginase-like protein (Ntn-hydrolase superfamily)
MDLLKNRTGSTGGLILIDRHGKAGYARNTTHMPICMITGGEGPFLDS